MPHLFFGLPLSLPPPHTHPSRLRAALGLSSGPADYKLMAGRQGCTLVKVTWAAVEQVPTEIYGGSGFCDSWGLVVRSGVY